MQDSRCRFIDTQILNGRALDILLKRFNTFLSGVHFHQLQARNYIRVQCIIKSITPYYDVVKDSRARLLYGSIAVAGQRARKIHSHKTSSSRTAWLYQVCSWPSRQAALDPLISVRGTCLCNAPLTSVLLQWPTLICEPGPFCYVYAVQLCAFCRVSGYILLC